MIIPEQYLKGKYLYQPETGRWYAFTEALANRADMQFIVDGVLSRNPYVNGNHNKQRIKDKVVHLDNSAMQLQQENEQLKTKYEDLLAQVKALQEAIQGKSQPVASVPPAIPALHLSPPQQ